MADEFKGMDWGFTFSNEEDLDIAQELETVQGDVQAVEADTATISGKLDEMYNAIQPLLNNLSRSPEKDYLYWKGDERLAKVEQFGDYLTSIYTRQ